jgi:hypothetical protein
MKTVIRVKDKNVFGFDEDIWDLSLHMRENPGASSSHPLIVFTLCRFHLVTPGKMFYSLDWELLPWASASSMA